MQENRDRGLRDAQLRFIGKILATLSHELKNHLAIIKEYSGLIQDLVETERRPSPGPAHQCVNSVRCIHQQIDKTLALLRYFNRFSHRMDISPSVYGVNEAVEELLALIHRLANQKKILLAMDFREDLPQVAGDPALLQFSLFRLIETAMNRIAEDGTLVLKTGPAKDAVTITIVARGVSTADAEKHPGGADEDVHEALRLIGGECSRTPTGEETTLTIPLAPSPLPARNDNESNKEP